MNQVDEEIGHEEAKNEDDHDLADIPREPQGQGGSSIGGIVSGMLNNNRHNIQAIVSEVSEEREQSSKVVNLNL